MPLQKLEENEHIWQTLFVSYPSLMKVTTVSRPKRQINSALLPFGTKCISGGGALGGGIESNDFSSCLRSASLAAACRWANVNVFAAWSDDDCLELVVPVLVPLLAPFVWEVKDVVNVMHETDINSYRSRGWKFFS